MLKAVEEALEFYAKPANWVRGGPGRGMRRGTPTQANRDAGDLARAALKKLKKQTHDPR